MGWNRLVAGGAVAAALIAHCFGQAAAQQATQSPRPSVPLDLLKPTPAATSTPMPTATPIPPPLIISPTPAAIATPSSQPVPAQTPQPAAAQAAAVESVAVKASLQRIRINRVMIFGDGSGLPAQLSNMDEANRFIEHWRSGMTVEYLLTPPVGWEVLAVEEAQLTKAVAAQGASLLGEGTIKPLNAGREDILPGDGKVTANFRLPIPPRDDRTLAALEARFSLAIAQRQLVSIDDAQRFAGQRILERELPEGVEVVLAEAAPDSLTVRIRGLADHLGEIKFYSPTGDEVISYGTEAHYPQPGTPVEAQETTLRFLFFNRPERLTMRVATYPAIRKVTVSSALTNISLP